MISVSPSPQAQGPSWNKRSNNVKVTAWRAGLWNAGHNAAIVLVSWQQPQLFECLHTITHTHMGAGGIFSKGLNFNSVCKIEARKTQSCLCLCETSHSSLSFFCQRFSSLVFADITKGAGETGALLGVICLRDLTWSWWMSQLEVWQRVCPRPATFLGVCG